MVAQLLHKDSGAANLSAARMHMQSERVSLKWALFFIHGRLKVATAEWARITRV